jgi:predicted aconitase
MTRAPLDLAQDERAMLAGDHGEGVALAMRLVVALARSSGATRLLPITSAHVDSCLYHGAASLDFARRLRDLGATVAVPTTSNVGSVDLLHPGIVHGEADELAAGRELMETYVELGCRTTFTCAPYQQLAHRPAFGEHVAWAESNAIAFVNSVLGARTARYGDFIDVAAAITARVPDAGFHRDADRLAALIVDCSAVSPALLREDAGWGALGLAVGGIVGSGVPALTGIDVAVTEDHLKAFGAGAASSGTVGMFHVVGVTPEAPDLAAVLPARPVPTVAMTTARLREARDELSPAGDRRLDAVSLGTPHFSLPEFAHLAAVLADGPPAHPDVEVYVSTSRAVLEDAREAGLVEPCERAGIRIVVDTCTYVTPILGPQVRHAMTNSAKWAWYAPANLGVRVSLGTLEECIASARAGHLVRDDTRWS